MAFSTFSLVSLRGYWAYIRHFDAFYFHDCLMVCVICLRLGDGLKKQRNIMISFFLGFFTESLVFCDRSSFPFVSVLKIFGCLAVGVEFIVLNIHGCRLRLVGKSLICIVVSRGSISADGLDKTAGAGRGRQGAPGLFLFFSS